MSYPNARPPLLTSLSLDLFRFLKVEFRNTEMQYLYNSFSPFNVLRTFCISCLKLFTFNYRLALVKLRVIAQKFNCIQGPKRLLSLKRITETTKIKLGLKFGIHPKHEMEIN